MSILSKLPAASVMLRWVVLAWAISMLVCIPVAFYKGYEAAKIKVTSDLLKEENAVVTAALVRESAKGKQRLDDLAKAYTNYLNYKLDAAAIAARVDTADISCEKVIIHEEPTPTPIPRKPDTPIRTVVTYRVSPDVARMFNDAFHTANSATASNQRQ